ncbi:MAG TPA: hypothetical protein VNB06_00725 [Thermoanaerobaculia bacterium]|nr:hypothetical protein [Thermoanaerobaculia bacterium]
MTAETGFGRYFEKLPPVRSLEQTCAEILAREKGTEGLLGEIIGESTQ